MDPIIITNRYFNTGDVEKIIGVTRRQLQYWDETGFFRPAYKTLRRRKYSFVDLIQLRVIHALLEKGATLQRIRKGVENLKRIIPGLTYPFMELEIDTDGESIFVHHKDSWFEAHTGQQMITFRVEDLFQKVAAHLEGGMEVEMPSRLRIPAASGAALVAEAEASLSGGRGKNDGE